MQKGIDDEGSPQQWSYLMLWPRHPHLITCLTDRNYSELLVSEEQDRLIQIQVTQHKTKDRGRSTMQRATINYDHPHHSILALALILKDFHFFTNFFLWLCLNYYLGLPSYMLYSIHQFS